ncbi:MAG: hypothetical protein AB7V39_04020 [Nitrospiraceae bacterium]
MRADSGDMPVAFRKTGSFSALDLLLIIFIVNLTLQPLVEPDFGWHLRAGLDFLDRGGDLPEQDPYSHTMPDWQWVEHAWLTDAIIALVYRGLGPIGALGAMMFFAGLATAAFVISAARAEAPRTSRLAVIMASLWVALPFLGARTQLVSLAGIALVLWLYHHCVRGKDSFIWLYPPLFLIWANLHGGFTAGLFLLGLILGGNAILHVLGLRWPNCCRSDEPLLSGSRIASLACSFGLSCAVTLINPYGWRLHREIYESLTDRLMLEQLREWQAVSFEGWAGTAFLVYLITVAVLAGAWYRRIEPIRWALLSVTLVWSLWHWRNVTIFLIVAVPLAADLFQSCRLWVLRFVPPGRRPLMQFGITVTVALLLVSLDGDHLQNLVSAGTEPAEFFRRTEYPIEAVKWIEGHRDEVGRRLYNDYGHGGFLLWWLPGEKIFIDGRMPAWRIGDRAIFPDYYLINNGGRPALTLLEKYGVDWGLVQRDSVLARSLGETPAWQEIYADGKVVILRRRT